MELRKQNLNAETVYAALFVLFSFVFVFEVPGVVFWAPTLLFLAFIVYSIYKKIPVRLSVSAALLLVFGIVYVYFTYNPAQSLYYQSYIFIQALFMFVIGYNFFSSDAPIEKRFAKLNGYILLIALFYVVYVCIIYGYYLLHIDTAPAADRKYWSVWYVGTVTKAATGLCVSMMFAVSWGTYAVFFSKKRWEKILGAALVAFCFIFNVITKTRLLVFLVPVLLFAAFFVWLIFRKKKLKPAVILLAAFLLVLAAAALVYHFKKDALKEAFAGTVFSRFFELGLRSTRWKYIRNVLTDFSLTYLGGGVHSEAVGVPHNFWLYVYDFGGIVPFAVYVLFTLVLVINFIRFLIKKRIPADLKIFVSIMMFTIFTEFMVEDLLFALPSYIMLSHFVFGVFSGLSGKEKKA